MFRGFRQELPPMFRLAWPVVMAEIGWMTMGLVDTMMVGRVGAAALGGVGIGSILFFTVAIFGSGLLLGLDTLVSQAFGAGKTAECHRSLLSGVYLSLVLTLPLMGALWLWPLVLGRSGIKPEVLREIVPYLAATTWSVLPQLLFFGLRRYLQSMNLVHPVMFALVSANVINAAANWVLIFGHLGAPAMGAEGAGWATCISRAYMALVLAGYALYHDYRHRTGLARVPLAPEWGRIRRLVGLGLPAALQLTGEVGVFAAATTLAGKLDKESLAAHHVALMMASFTYMVPLGVSSAAAVRVGQALGRGDTPGAARAGWTALLLGAGFMSLAGLAFWLVPRPLVRAFTTDPLVVTAGASLLLVAAFFQLFDGLQIVVTGALRGAGDTRTPMICHLGLYWLIGLPLGYWLCFTTGWGVRGLWVGLSAALILIGAVMTAVWARTVRSLAGRVIVYEST